MKKVLLVDDDPILLKVATAALAPYADEFTVITASNGEEAIKVLAVETVDAVSTDLQMPVMNGFQLLAYLLKNCPDLPVIVTTAQDTSKLKDRVKGFGSIAYLHKPIDYDALLQTIRDRLQENSKGYITGVTLFSVLQLLQLEQKTCVLKVKSHGREGVLAFDRGELVNALYEKLVGEVAVYQVLAWEDTQIEIRDVVSQLRRVINTPLSMLLMEALRLKDEQDNQPGDYNEDRSDVNNGDVHNSAEADPFILPVPDELALDDALADIGRDALDIQEPLGLSHHKEPQRLISQQGQDVVMTTVDVTQTLNEAMTITGAMAVALVDLTTGMALGTMGGAGIDLDVAASGNTEVVKAKLKTMQELGIKGQIEDILITLQTQYHLIRPLGSDSTVFLYLVLNKTQANLAMARRTLAKIENGLQV